MRYLAADVGGTFTDLVLVDGAAGVPRVFIDKVPSQATGSAAGVEEGIRRIAGQAGIAPGEIDLFVHGFTVGTNAFLTRSGARAVLVVTEGFRDVLAIGDQRRPDIYSLSAEKPAPVVPRARTVEVKERLDAFGNVVTPLADGEPERVAAAVAALDPEAVAVCLTFSYLDPGHEAAIAAAIGRRLQNVPVYLSSRVNPQIEEFPRANTTAVAAYAGPVIDRYIEKLEQNLTKVGFKGPLRLMRSDGGVATPRAARDNPAHMLLSGPAGGVIAGAELARALGIDNLVTFDMGGTSADFSVITGGTPSMVREREIDGQPLRLPTIDIETISAGGGSIAHVDIGGALKVGPKSAGAVPGPACYGQGGSAATVTDAAVVMGLLDPQEYLGGEMKLDPQLARAAVERAVARPLGLSVEEAAFGIVSIANANMIQAIRTLSVERGHDVRGFSLLAFGGAGPLYAPYMARELGMAEVIAPRNPGVFAAQGLLLTDIRHAAQAPWQRRLKRIDASEIGKRLATLRRELDHELGADGVKPAARYFRFSADMRCVGQFHLLNIPLPAPDGDGWWDPVRLAAAFHAAHERAYGHADPAVPVELVNLRVDGFGRIDRLPEAAEEAAAQDAPAPIGARRVYFDRATGWTEAAIYRRAQLKPGHRVAGPAIIMQRDSTLVVLPGQAARTDRRGTVRIAERGD